MFLLNKLKYLSFNTLNISISGLRHLTNLVELHCANSLITLNVLNYLPYLSVFNNSLLEIPNMLDELNMHSSLTDLSIYNTYIPPTELYKLPNLTKLVCLHKYYYTNKHLLSSSLSKVKELIIDNTFQCDRTIYNLMVNLTHLTDKDNNLINIKKNNKEFSLSDNISDSLINLKYLNLGFNSLSNTFFNKLTNLTYLNCGKNKIITDDAIKDLILLEYLNIESADNITDIALLNLKKLKILLVNSNITDNGFINIFNLEWVSIYSNNYITNNVLIQNKNISYIEYGINTKITKNIIQYLKKYVILKNII
jgi:hypothetical protein